MKLRVLLALLLALPLAAAEDPDRPLLEGVDLSPRDEDFRVSILIEVGAVSPALDLLDLGEPKEVSLTLRRGPAEFLVVTEGDPVIRRVKEFHYRGTRVEVPPIHVGSDTRESTLAITLDGVPLGSNLRVKAMPKDGFETIWLAMQSAKPAIVKLDLEARYGIFDPMKFNWDALPADAEMLERRKQEEEQQKELEAQPEEIDGGGSVERCPELVWMRPRPTDEFPINDCMLNLRPYAKIEFTNVPDPRRSGYSVKLESVDDGSLVWAQGLFMIGIDGLYRTSWGCGVALKVPNNAILTIDGLMPSCCRGPFALAADAHCAWISTLAEANWADCPL